MAAGQSQKQYWQHYRESTLGCSFTDALDQFISTHQIEPQLALKLLFHFDQAVAQVLKEQVKAKMSFKAHGPKNEYKDLMGEWRFDLRNVDFKLDDGQIIQAERIRIVAMNARGPE